MHNDELIKIVRKQNFSTFWHCFDYLMLAGYNQFESYDLASQEFNKRNKFEGLVYINITHKSHLISLGEPNLKYRADIGIGVDTRLTVLYDKYRKWRQEPMLKNYSEFGGIVETTCDKLTIIGLTKEILNPLIKESNLYFGFDIFKIPPEIISPGIFTHEDRQYKIRTAEEQKLYDDLEEELKNTAKIRNNDRREN